MGLKINYNCQLIKKYPLIQIFYFIFRLYQVLTALKILQIHCTG